MIFGGKYIWNIWRTNICSNLVIFGGKYWIVGKPAMEASLQISWGREVDRKLFYLLLMQCLHFQFWLHFCWHFSQPGCSSHPRSQWQQPVEDGKDGLIPEWRHKWFTITEKWVPCRTEIWVTHKNINMSYLQNCKYESFTKLKYELKVEESSASSNENASASVKWSEPADLLKKMPIFHLTKPQKSQNR